MQWTYLGHAGWLAEAGGVRLLFDPLLEETHYGGVFETVPRRRLLAKALKPDFIFVSHAHPDHFDVQSLVLLADFDPDSVLLSPDPWVCNIATRAGFRTCQELAPGQRVQLQGADVVATPSLAAEPECGFFVAGDSACVWNLVDCVFSSPQEVEALARASLDATNTETLDAALIRWQPLKEVDAILGNSLGFPFDAYNTLLQEAAATGACTLLASSSATRHCTAYEHMNALVYPVHPERFVRDLSQVAPSRNIVFPELGQSFRVANGRVSPQAGASSLLADVGPDHPPLFHPTALLPMEGSTDDADSHREEITTWVQSRLLPGLSEQEPSASLLLVLEVLTGAAPLHFCIELDHAGARLSDRPAHDYDLLNQVTSDDLVSVLRGQAAWGELLLSGRLRVVDRAYTVTAQLSRISFLPTFVYYGLSYEESERRVTEMRLDAALKRLASRKGA